MFPFAPVAVALALTASAAPDSSPHYRLTVQVDPNAHSIAVRGRIDGRRCDSDGKLYLNRNFRIESFKVGGRAAAVTFDTAAKPAEYTDATRPLVFDCKAGPIELAYTGMIADTMNGVNMIAPNLVELALYSGWFPLYPTGAAFSYDVQLYLPRGWTAATAGRTSSERRAGRTVVHVASAAPGMDIPLVAAPGLVMQRAGGGAAAIEVYSAPADTDIAAATIRNLQRSIALYRDWFGEAAAADAPLPTRVVFSPRGGWGYSRLPLILGPAVVMRKWSGIPVGKALILQGAAHELGHFWWKSADTNTTDDWVNEGLAEYSAFSAATAILGPEVRDSLMAGYRRHAAAARTTAPVATTATASPDRYVNRYEKPTLLLASIEASVGAPRVHGFLRDFHARYGGPRQATTVRFLEVARETLGTDVAARIERCVTGAWSADCGS